MLFSNISRREQVLRGKYAVRFECACRYKSYLVLKESKPISRDSDLQQLNSDTYTQQISSIDQVVTAHDVIMTAMAKTLVGVRHILFEKRALSLPAMSCVPKE